MTARISSQSSSMSMATTSTRAVMTFGGGDIRKVNGRADQLGGVLVDDIFILGGLDDGVQLLHRRVPVLGLSRPSGPW